jgi:hypothetical protein
MIGYLFGENVGLGMLENSKHEIGEERRCILSHDPDPLAQQANNLPNRARISLLILPPKHHIPQLARLPVLNPLNQSGIVPVLELLLPSLQKLANQLNPNLRLIELLQIPL